MPRENREFRGYPRGWRPPALPDGATLALSVVLNIEEGSERSFRGGDGSTEASGEGFFGRSDADDERIRTWYAYAKSAAAQRLDGIFRETGIPVTAFAASRALEADDALAAMVRDGDYEVCSHGHRWVPTNDLDPEGLRAHVEQATASLEATTGRRPVGWFSRGPSTHLRDALADVGGFRYDSDAFADDLPWFVEVRGAPWLVIPYSFTHNDMKYWRSPGVSSPSEFLGLLRASFDRLVAESRVAPKMMSVGLHLRGSGLPSRAGVVREFLEHARTTPGVWITTRDRIADWAWNHVDDFPVMRG